MSELRSLRECLFHAFANSNHTNPQDAELMWAIQEGIRRINRHRTEWREVLARKDHECIRGCTIKRGELYFQYELSEVRRSSDSKFCAPCMAMILYFKDVAQMRPAFGTHWDLGEKRPVKLSEKPSKG
jgi:hypothetical protein